MNGDVLSLDWMQHALSASRVFGYQSTEKIILVKVSEQALYLLQYDCVLDSYPISSSRYGIGNLQNSHRTPLGAHKIAKKIGGECALGEILKAREPTGRLAETQVQDNSTGIDVITTRILWLSGLEEGLNQGGDVDSYRRYIYIHGTPDEGLIGQPASIGCIRMKNADVISLYDHVDEGGWVYIAE